MSLNGVISRFATGVYTVTRTVEGAYVDGELVAAAGGVELDVTAVNATLDRITVAAHGRVTGDGPYRLVLDDPSAQSLPQPLSVDTPYYVIVVDANTLRLALSNADAIALVAVDITTTESTFEISSTRFQRAMCVQPATGRELDAIPEADRTSDTKLVLCDVELQTRKPGFDWDSIDIDGDDHTVIKSERWTHWGETHWRVLAARDEVR